jgi:tight adherence protein B
MNDRSWMLLGGAANALLPLGTVALFVCARRSPTLRGWVAGYQGGVALDLRYLQASLPAHSLLRAQLRIAVCLLAVMVAFGALWPAPLLAATALGPRLWLSRQRRRRTQRIEQQLDTWLLALSNELKVNPALGESLAQSARLMGAPLSEELSLLHKETRLGMPLDRALRQMSERAQSPVVSAAIATLRVARNTGGNLSETLDASAASLREMARLEGVVRTKTAEGRAQALLIGVLPAPLLLLLHAIDPKLLEPLWSSARGHLVLAAAACLWLAALLSARKIVAVDI